MDRFVSAGADWSTLLGPATGRGPTDPTAPPTADEWASINAARWSAEVVWKQQITQFPDYVAQFDVECAGFTALLVGRGVAVDDPRTIYTLWVGLKVIDYLINVHAGDCPVNEATGYHTLRHVSHAIQNFMFWLRDRAVAVGAPAPTDPGAPGGVA